MKSLMIVIALFSSLSVFAAKQDSWKTDCQIHARRKVKEGFPQKNVDKACDCQVKLMEKACGEPCKDHDSMESIQFTTQMVVNDELNKEIETSCFKK